MITPRRAVIAGLLATAGYPAVAGIRALTSSTAAAVVPAAGVPARTPVVLADATAPEPQADAPATVPAAPVQHPAPTAELPPYKRFAVAPPPHDGKPIICIVMDDLGVMHEGTERTLALPGPMTLSWFPFAQHLDRQVAEGTSRGHETTLHMPMQSFSNSTAQTGPDPLRIDLAPEINMARLRNAMDAVPNTVGLNNHMGSVATKNVPLMDLVAAETKARNMLFLDSLTVRGSVAKKQAVAAGVFADARDAFIDDSSDPVKIREALDIIEKIARKYGNVIAIGHPRPHTVEAMEWWMPTLASKGFVLWPLAATMALRADHAASTAAVTHV